MSSDDFGHHLHIEAGVGAHDTLVKLDEQELRLCSFAVDFNAEVRVAELRLYVSSLIVDGVEKTLPGSRVDDSNRLEVDHKENYTGTKLNGHEVKLAEVDGRYFKHETDPDSVTFSVYVPRLTAVTRGS